MINRINRGRFISTLLHGWIVMLFFSFFVTLAIGNQQAYEPIVHVSAGAYDRQETVVLFELPVDLSPGAYRLFDQQGEWIPLQVDDANRGWFIVEELPAGKTAEYRLDTLKVTTTKKVTRQIDSDLITMKSGDSRVLRYYHGENDPPEELDERYRRGGYIHPVYSPSGVVLTNHLNPDQHPHHAGIWSAWTNTEFEGRSPDFWNVHNNTGRVDIDSLLTEWQGPIHGGFRSAHRFTDLSVEKPVTALNEQWEVRVYSPPRSNSVHIFDLKVTQTANSDQPLKLPEHRYGGVGFRGHKDWDDPDNGFFLTSDGLGRDGHATRARWAHMGGHSDGTLAGFAILGHPSNYRFPQTMRIHPSGAFFNFAPTQLGDMTIEPGNPYVARYRIVTYDGEPDSDLIDRLWRDYAYPPGVTVKE